ncbi:PREDICTED: Retrovirus-related Pol poly from transposon TNT [Prunus dulcis]|uniref:PREDICTED: Retrovirus-related Pol poly from transposon TNT n=1 Tax=Prunus dulcis TaxID=3755 RepID=A0A5E4FDZ1_PRUDU|nr:PREDICTED: Retrovirus-related Pol poly from transposon TNT [Prunus dulcis]
MCQLVVTVTDEERNKEVMANSSGSKISLGDKTNCDVLGVGITKIKMQDGVVRSSEVRHVLALRMNLISLGDREGYSYKAKEGKLLITQVKVLDFKGIAVAVAVSEDKVVMEGTPKGVEFDTRAEENGGEQQTQKGVLFEVEPSLLAKFEPKESNKPSTDFEWMDKKDSTMF